MHSVSGDGQPHYWYWRSNDQGLFKGAIWGTCPEFILQLEAISMVIYSAESGIVVFSIQNICRGELLDEVMGDIYGIVREGDMLVDFKSDQAKYHFLEFLGSQGVKVSKKTE